MKPKVIIFEDEYLINYSLTKKISANGFEVLSFSDPTECPIFFGPEQKSQEDFDLVRGDYLLTDNRMPNMTGLEFVEQHMQNGWNGVFMNIAVMSAAWSDRDIVKAKKFGCEVFNKPLSIEEILVWLGKGKCLLEEDRRLVS